MQIVHEFIRICLSVKNNGRIKYILELRRVKLLNSILQRLKIKILSLTV